MVKICGREVLNEHPNMLLLSGSILHLGCIGPPTSNEGGDGFFRILSSDLQVSQGNIDMYVILILFSKSSSNVLPGLSLGWF